MERILIIGGGLGGLAAYRQLHKLLHPCDQNNCRIELIDRYNYSTFVPMLHEVATGSVSREHAVQPIREIMRCCGNVFHRAEVERIRERERVVQTDKGNFVYDQLVIAMGVKAGWQGVLGADKYGYSLKSLQDAIKIRHRIIGSFERLVEGKHNGETLKKKSLCFVVVGGGMTGVELTGQIADLLNREMVQLYPGVLSDQVRLVLVHAGDRLLDGLPEKVSAVAHARLMGLGAEVVLSKRVQEVTKREVVLSGGDRIETDNVFWTTGTESGMRGVMNNVLLDDRGLVVVDKYRRVRGLSNMWAVGDVAVTNEERWRTPPTGQAAVWEAKQVARNMVARFEDRKMKAKQFSSKGDIMPIGNWYGILVWHKLVWRGRLAWLVRRMVFLMTMQQWGDRLRVLSDWMINFFQPRDTSDF